MPLDLVTEGLVIGNTPAPFELLVQEMTDQGKQRPMKVVRLYAPGSKKILAELQGVRLVWFKGDEFVLTGTDISLGERAHVHVAQTWLCKLALPPSAAICRRLQRAFPLRGGWGAADGADK